MMESKPVSRPRPSSLVLAGIAAAAATMSFLGWSPARAADAATPAPGPAVVETPLLEGANPEETYDLNFVGIQHTEFGGYTTAGPGGMYVPKTELWNGFRGKYKTELDALNFYDAVDRPDLHRTALYHLIAQASFAFGGLGLIIGGGIYEYRHRDDPNGLPKAGWFVMGGGLICVVVAKIIGPYPITEHEAIILARTHNDRLRTRLGLPPVTEDPTAAPAPPGAPRADDVRRPRQERWVVMPAIAEGAGGLVLAGSF